MPVPASPAAREWHPCRTLLPGQGPKAPGPGQGPRVPGPRAGPGDNPTEQGHRAESSHTGAEEKFGFSQRDWYTGMSFHVDPWKFP